MSIHTKYDYRAKFVSQSNFCEFSLVNATKGYPGPLGNTRMKHNLGEKIMITLRGKLKKDGEVSNSKSKDFNKRASVRDKLLVKEVQEMEQTLPATCQITFDDPHRLHDFNLLIVPEEGYWANGRFSFHIYITEEYNMTPPKVKCMTKLWHPNINEDGDVCLSILRQNSIDGMGWAPTRKLKDVVWGLNSLFTDLLNFDDPLNRDAAELFIKDKESFRNKVQEYVMQYAKR